MNKVTMVTNTTDKLTSADFGAIFETESNGYCILAQVGPDIGAFICLCDGNRYFDPLPIEDLVVPDKWIRVRGAVQIEIEVG